MLANASDCEEVLYNPAAKVGQRQHKGADQAEPDDAPSPPPFMVMSPEQQNIDEPGKQGEHGLVQVLFVIDQVIHIEQTSAERQREQNDANLRNVKHLALNAH